MPVTYRLGFLPLFGVAGVDFTAAEVAESIAGLDGKPFTLRLNSGGGIAAEALAVADLLKAYPGEIMCVLEGAVAGASVAIAMACAKIHASPGSWLGIANPFTVAFGDVNEIAAVNERLETETNAIAQMIADFHNHAGTTSATPEGERSVMLSEKWMVCHEIVASGYATSFTRDDVMPPYPARPFHYGMYAKAPVHLVNDALLDGLVGVPSWALGPMTVTGAPSARARIESGPVIANAQRAGQKVVYKK